MAKHSLLDEREDPLEVNLAPMIDCVFILLIFFIVTTVFVEAPGVEIVKPDATVDVDLEKHSILIGISSENKILYGGKVMGVAGVGARVKQLLNKEELPVIIQADSGADHGVFSDVWTEVKNAGANKISVSTRND